MRYPLFFAAAGALAACSPAIPDSAAGVSALPPARAISDESTAAPIGTSIAITQGTFGTAPAGTPAAAPGTPTTSIAARPAAPRTQTDSAALAAETQAALAASRANSGQQPLQASPDNPPPQTVETAAGISGENDFEAVGSVRSIESDAEFIARNRQRYQVVRPEALPARRGETGPNIVAYALSTSHPLGARVYTRIGINKQARFARNCAKYASDDLAQLEFLEKGGPGRDRLGLDPDGDGYACGWDPAPFRLAVQN